MIARILLVLGLALMAPALAAQPLPRMDEMPRLKPVARVAHDVVRIGDLIENAGAVSDIAIFRAPDPGTTGTVSAERVLEAARARNLLLVDSAGVTHVEVTRVSRPVPRAEIERRIVRAFSRHFTSTDMERFAVTFDREPRTIHVDPQFKGDLQTVRAGYDPRSMRFDITLEVPGEMADQRYVRYTGTLVETVQAVVLVRPVNRGETIRASDVTIERRPKAEVTVDALTSIDEIAGMAARQALRAGPVLKRNDLVKAEVVKREEPVTLVYEVPGITLATRGKALESGAEGDLINVLNLQSKRTVQGVVAGPGRVVIPATQPVMVTEAAAATKSE